MFAGTSHILNDKVIVEPLGAYFEILETPSEQKLAVKYLGVHIDNKLKWKYHIKAIASKVTHAIATNKYSKTFIPQNTLKMLYQGLVEPHLRSCCSAW